MKKTMIGLPFLIFLGACGQPGSTKAPTEKITSTTYTNSPVSMRKQTQKCQSKRFEQDSALINLHLFVEAKYVKVARDFFPFLKGNSLRDGKVIAKTVYGEESEIFVTDKGMRIRTTVNPRELKICPDEDEYEQNTIESAALNATYFIHQTNAKIKTVFPELRIKPITLSIGPKVVRSVVTRDWNSGKLSKESLYITDNALYTPALSMITFLPHSKTLKENGFSMNFWEVPMVASHEYGHHVFQSIYGGSNNPLACFGHGHADNNPLNKGLGFERKVKQEDVMTAYNEGFADLVAHYTLGESEKNVEGVKCLEVSRDVASPAFYNGKPKIFDEEAMRTFFLNYKEFSLGGCEEMSFQEAHTIGAIFAHSADKFLGNFTSSNDEKLVAIVDWVKYLKAEKKKFILMSPRNFMKRTMSDFVKMSLAKFDKPLDADHCKLVEEIYPQLDLDECAKKEI